MPHAAPPPDLAYLAPALDDFAAAFAGGTDAEDLDPVPLERALKARLVDEPDPAAAVAGDAAALESWLNGFDSGDHPGWAAAGMLRGLLTYGFEVETLGEDPDPGPLPSVSVETPAGWTAEAGPSSLSLKKGTRGALYAHFLAAPPGLPFPLREQWAAARLPAEPVAFGPVSGTKMTTDLPGPPPHKQVQYVLDAPGGTVSLTVFRTTGKPFDEAEIEAVLPTLRVRPAAA